jgi:site-specific DNA-methyltransferase (adenine-specific)
MSGCDVSIQSGPPITEAAKQWSGWGTALKPAHEPIVVARKPLVGTVAANVLQHGTGALNIDGCRVSGELPHHNYGRTSGERSFVGESSRPYNTPELGRWPANVIHDGSEEVVSCFPNAPGQCGAVRPDSGSGQKTDGIYGRFATNSDHDPRGDSGSAARFFYKVEPDSGDSGVSQLANQRVGEPSAERTYEERGGTSFTLKPGARRFDMGSPARFFYCAKADREERNRGCEELGKKPLLWSAGTQSPGTFQREGVDRSAQNNHPTVKPVALMAYLCRLVTPPGGTVLDCFMGSGSTGIAALREGFHFIGIEVNPAYAEIARRRIAGDAPLLNQATEKGETSDEDGAQAYSGGD